MHVHGPSLARSPCPRTSSDNASRVSTTPGSRASAASRSNSRVEAQPAATRPSPSRRRRGRSAGCRPPIRSPTPSPSRRFDAGWLDARNQCPWVEWLGHVIVGRPARDRRSASTSSDGRQHQDRHIARRRSSRQTSEAVQLSAASGPAREIGAASSYWPGLAHRRRPPTTAKALF